MSGVVKPVPAPVTLTVLAVAGLATIQDEGRPGRMHEGIPPGGPCVPERLARANALAGNHPDDAAIELFGSMTLTTDAAIVVASDRATAPRVLARGEPWTVNSRGRRVAYLALRGGIDVPMLLGGRSTLLVACLGGHEGRPLRKGDRLRLGAPGADADAGPDAVPDAGAILRVIPGPDLSSFAPGALETLLSTAYEVSPRSDRVGVRLLGAALVRRGHDTAVSAPMVRGAIQVPASGEPIVLGPDHPTTGGYPVLATLVHADRGAVMAIPVGARVSFRP